MSLLLNHSKTGTGPALIILHGLFGSSSNWRTIATALSSHFTVYSLDARNHGNSAWRDSMSYAEMADDVVRFLDYHSIDRANVLGHSMGGKTAMSLSLNHPSRVNRLVVADMSIKSYPDSSYHDRNIEAMLSLDLAQLSGGRKQAELLLSEKLNEPRPVIHFMLQNLVIKDGIAKWRINLPVIQHSLKSIMRAIDNADQQDFDGDSLFLFGKNSDYVQLQDHEAIMQLFPKAVFSGIENAGHWLHAEQPVEFAEKVKEFLS